MIEKIGKIQTTGNAIEDYRIVGGLLCDCGWTTFFPRAISVDEYGAMDWKDIHVECCKCHARGWIDTTSRPRLSEAQIAKEIEARCGVHESGLTLAPYQRSE